MTTTPTPEQFLAEPTTEEDDLEQAEQATLRPGLTIQGGSVTFGTLATPPVTALDSIAESLRTLTEIVVRTDEGHQADEESERRHLDLNEAYDDLEAKHRSLFDLLAEVEKIVKPSTSKLANSVRDAINAWKAPGIPAVEPGETPEPVPPTVVDLAGQGLEQPVIDASIDEWREYAQARGVESAEQMNRSQIRTALGLPHFEG